MSEHELSFRYERRWSLVGLGHQADSYSYYPCLVDCQNPAHARTHTGETTFIYARCSCDEWELLVGDHINEAAAKLEGRLQFLQHQIDVLRGSK